MAEGCERSEQPVIINNAKLSLLTLMIIITGKAEAEWGSGWQKWGSKSSKQSLVVSTPAANEMG